jgi:hypothetical protein
MITFQEGIGFDVTHGTIPQNAAFGTFTFPQAGRVLLEKKLNLAFEYFEMHSSNNSEHGSFWPENGCFIIWSLGENYFVWRQFGK